MSNNKDIRNDEGKKKPAEVSSPVKSQTPCGLKVDIGMEGSCNCQTCRESRSKA